MSFNARIYLRGTYPPKGRLGAGGGCMLLRSDASTCARSDYDPTVPIRVACRAARPSFTMQSFEQLALPVSVDEFRR